MSEAIVEARTAPSVAQMAEQPTKEVQWIACRACGGEIGVPPDFHENRVECPGCGLAVLLDQTVLFRPAVPAATPSGDQFQKSEARPQQSRGGEIKIAKMIRGLEEIANANETFVAEQGAVGHLVAGLFVFVGLLIADVALLNRAVPDKGQQGEWRLNFHNY